MYENGFVDMDAKHRGWSSYLGAGVERGGKKGKGRREGRAGKGGEGAGGGEEKAAAAVAGGAVGEKERSKQLDQYSKFLQSASSKAKGGDIFN